MGRASSREYSLFGLEEIVQALPLRLFRRLLILLLLGVCPTAGLSLGETSTWNGSGSNSLWSSADNWQSGTAPISSLSNTLVFSGAIQPSSINTTSLLSVSQLSFVSPVVAVTRTFFWSGTGGYTASGTFSYTPSAAVGGVISATGSAASGGGVNNGLDSLNVSFSDPSQTLLGSYTNATGGAVTYSDLMFSFDTQASQFVKDFQLGGSYSLNGQATAPPAPFSELDGPSGFLDDTSGTSGLTLTGSAASNLVPFTLSGSSIQIAGGGSIVTESPQGAPSLTDTIAMPVVSSAGGFTVTLGGSVGSVRNLAITGPVSGAGGLALNGGSGTLTLTGSNSYSGGTVVSAGTLQIGSGGTSGVIAGNITNGGTLIFNRSDDLTYADSISGAGVVTKLGAGILTLSGSNASTGTLTVVDGELNVNGSTAVGSEIIVARGSVLSGTGTIGGNTTIYGIHSPGNSPGIQEFTNDLTYAQSELSGPSVYWQLAANITSNSPPVFDQVNVGGNLDFAAPTSLHLAFDGSGSQVSWSDVFWSTDEEWTVYQVGGALSSFSNLLISSANWGDGQGQWFNTLLPGATFSLLQVGSNVLLKYTAFPIAVPEIDAAAFGGAVALLAGALSLLERRRRGQKLVWTSADRGQVQNAVQK
jgi:autotransporter-associated beta strand protein